MSETRKRKPRKVGRLHYWMGHARLAQPIHLHPTNEDVWKRLAMEFVLRTTALNPRDSIHESIRQMEER